MSKTLSASDYSIKKYIDSRILNIPASGGNSGSGASSISELIDWPTNVSAIEIGYLDGVTSSIQNQFDNKVDKITGKGLSTEDFTTSEKNKLDSISGTNTGDQDLSGLVPKTTTVNTKALSSNITLSTADIADSTDKRYCTDAEKTIISNTSGTNTGDQDLSGLVPKATTVNGHALTANVSVTASDVGINYTLDTDISLASNSDVKVPSQKAVKTYVDNKVLGMYNPAATGLVWSSRILPANVRWQSIAYGNGKLVAIAGRTAPTNVYAYSSNYGNTWTQSTLPASDYWSFICWSGTQFVAVAGAGNNPGSTNVAVSSDGVTWTSKTASVQAQWASVDANGTGTVCAVANANSSNISSNQVMRSSDNGNTWVTKTLPSNAYWNSVCYGNGKWVAVSGGFNRAVGTAAAYSTDDGLTWTAATLPSSQYWATVIWSSSTGLFIALPGSGANSAAYATSPDGINWTGRTLPASAGWHGIASGPLGVVIMTLSSENVCYTSYNGIDWSTRYITTKANVTQIIWTGEIFATINGYNAYATQMHVSYTGW